MPTWAWIVLLCAVVLALGWFIDKRARAKRAGLVRPADTTGRSSSTVRDGVRPHLDNSGVAGTTPGTYNPLGSSN